jgi:hypothetical protein
MIMQTSLSDDEIFYGQTGMPDHKNARQNFTGLPGILFVVTNIFMLAAC